MRMSGVTTGLSGAMSSEMLECLRRRGGSLCVTPRPGIPKQRCVFRNTTIAPPIAYGVHTNCIRNVLRGVVERVFFVEGALGLQAPPQPLALVFDELLPFRNGVARYVGKATPVSLDEFVGMYRGRKQTIYREAARSLNLQGITRRDAFLSTFVKAEKVRFEEAGQIYDPAPRVIQPRSPRFNAAVGVYLKPIEHRVYSAIDRMWGGPTVMKGLNVQKRGAAFVEVAGEFRQPMFVSSDYARFDQSVSVPALRFEHGLYTSVYPGRPGRALKRLLRMQLENHGVARCPDGKLEYVVNGCRMSGDMNTSMGNVFLASAVAWGYLQECGFNFRLLNDGDDCVFVMEASNAPAFVRGFAAYALRFGFRAKVEKPVAELAQVDFCQCSPIWTPDGTIMVRNPWKALAKDSTSLLPLDQAGMAERLYTSLGVGGLSMSSGIPVYESFYTSLRRAGRGRTFGSLPTILDSGFEYMHRGVRLINNGVHPRTRFEFWRAFGILPDLQLVLEDYYGGLEIPTVPTPGCFCPTDSTLPLITKFF